ncbi:MAG: hypothetical protein ACC656_11160, partial [Candidatus Heimdallarchaeota archaeon]
MSSYQTSQAVSVDQEIPKFVLRNKTFTSTGEVIKGVEPGSDNSNAGFELIFSRLRNARTIERLWGSPQTDLNATHVFVNGSVNGDRVQSYRTVQSFLQKAEYVEDVPVNKRIQRKNQDSSRGATTLNIDRLFTIPTSYANISTNENFTKVERPANNLEAYVTRYFYSRMVERNNSDGSISGTVYGFKVVVLILVFDSVDKQFLGLHRIEDFGYGNMLPDFVNTYLLKLPERPDKAPNQKIRDIQNGSRPGPLKKVDWIDLGYNSTYDLDMKLGFYNFERSALTFILPRRVLTSNSLGLSQSDTTISTDIESLIDDISAENELVGFDDGELESIDDQVLDVSLDEDGVSLDNPFPSSTTTTSSSA